MPVVRDSEDETFRAFSDALQEWDSQVGLQAGTLSCMSFFGALLQLLMSDAGGLVTGFCSKFPLVRFSMCALVFEQTFELPIFFQYTFRCVLAS